ncbi:Heavy metal-associated isoprenylated plant protein 9 [Vitis vinifera]|uniref:Heavy metal-associated isoprenylated plant protein 9 n=1 Tax=Vitis vinifera TaxID=29760 RepID=A0A438FLS5_VITVI|nr:Heavy metal-associated isoprenylated plant protein 9 [Vitis vinifera]RVW60966.1 Heavy metal-associated isoprenylated plant protein 9 [Vitis vinifera]
MGEEAKEQAPAEVKPEAEEKEEKAEEKKEEKPEEPKEEPKPPLPFVLFVDLHCVGCAKKIERSLMKIRGVEEVMIDMAQNQVTIKGIVEPQAVCNRIMKKTKRRAKVLSPLPEAEGEPMPEVVSSQVSGLTTVELNVNMHCEACAAQLKRKILKMRGVQTAETELSTSKVTVTGTMDADRLVDYVYRRTKKQARIVPQPEPEKQEENKEGEKPAEEAKPEEKKEENAEKAEEGKPPEEAKKGEEGNGGENNESKEEKGGENKEEGKVGEIPMDDETMKRMMYYYQPLYVIERMPPPQLFSDENPNACCIS